jgi:hypothetical protein
LRLTRRRALAGIAGTALLVSGCSRLADQLPDGPVTAPADPDRSLLEHAVRAEEAIAERVRETLRRHHALRSRLQETLHVHEAHLVLLTGPDRTGVVQQRRVPGTTSAALAAVVGAERHLEATHVALAMRAQSGAFARVLAGLAAAAAQQATLVPGPGGHVG